MFTVKVYGSMNRREVHSCESYIVTPPGEPVAAGEPSHHYQIHLFDKRIADEPNASKLTIIVDHVVYIENANGHTVDVIRASTIA